MLHDGPAKPRPANPRPAKPPPSKAAPAQAAPSQANLRKTGQEVPWLMQKCAAGSIGLRQAAEEGCEPLRVLTASIPSGKLVQARRIIDEDFLAHGGIRRPGGQEIEH